MIAYDLQCANGHTFEGWFEDGQAYEAQKTKGLIGCPVCDDTSVSKIPSTFAIKSSHFTKKPAVQQADLAKLGKKSSILWRKISMMSVVILPKRP